MSWKRPLQWVLFTTVLGLAGVGCKQYYNGALGGINKEDREAIRAYSRQMQAKQAEEARRRQAEASKRAPHIGLDGGVTGLPPEGAQHGGGGLHPGQGVPVPALPGKQGSRVDPDLMYLERGLAAPPAGSLSSAESFSPNRVPRVHRRPVTVYGQMLGERGMVSPLDTTGQFRRVSFTEEGSDFDVTLNAAGTHMLYSSTRHRQTADIYRQKVDGTAVTQLTDGSANDVMPAISPDGKTIAFASDRSGNWDLYLMDASGGPAVQLTSDRTHDIHPSFSPDGKRLVYCSLSERTGQWQMVTLELGNPAVRRYIGHGLFPQWSPKGDTILYQRARERGTRWFSVWTVELNERGEAGSPTEVLWSSAFACITPAWSPDGKAVVFCTVTNPQADIQRTPVESDVWIARADGSARTRLTHGRFANLQPVWSGDHAIYFVSNRSGRSTENIWALNPSDAIKVAFATVSGPKPGGQVKVPN